PVVPGLLFGGEPVRRMVDGSTGLDAVVWQRLDLGFALARRGGRIPTAPAGGPRADGPTGRWTAMTFARGSSVPSARPLRERPADRLRLVMRLLAALGVLSPLTVAALVIGIGLPAPPGMTAETWQLVLTGVAIAAGVSTTSLVVWLYLRLWFGRLVRAAEKIAEGDLDVRVSERGSGLDGRLAAAVNGIALSMAEKQDAARIDKLTGVRDRQQLLATLFSEVAPATANHRALL